MIMGVVYLIAIQRAILPASTARYGTSSPEYSRHLSPSIALKRKFLAVDLTVNAAYIDKRSHNFNCLYVPETIEWE